jgi:MoaA/NifB/PqqE/SkfB family radical SAM enzyme
MTGTSWKTINEELIRSAARNHTPLMGTFELTARCNLNCKMCYIHDLTNDKRASANELTAKQWIKTAEEAVKAGMLHLLLTGGEVFARQDFRSIYEALSSMGIYIRIITNAALIDRDTAAWLSKRPPARVEVTMYGATPGMYGRLCGDHKAYRRTVDGIRSLIGEGINVQLRTTIINDNLRHFGKIAEFAESHKLSLSVVDYVSPRRERSGTAPTEVRLEPKKIIRLIERLSKRKGKQPERTTGSGEYTQEAEVTADPLDTICEELFDTNDGSPYKCAAGKCSFWITWDGRMLPCGITATPSAPLAEGSFESCWNMLHEKVQAVPACNACMSCSLKRYCLTCPARLKNETGYFDKPADYLCNMALLNKMLQQGGDSDEGIH